MTRSMAALGLVIATCLSCSGPANRSPKIPMAEQLRADAEARATKEAKQVFLLFTAPAVSWCELFDQYHADPDVSRIIDKHLIVTRIDIKETPGGEQMYLEFGGINTLPAFSILDAHGMLLANSGYGDQNIGFPAQPQEVESYFTALKTACPKLSDEDIEVLREKLKELRPKEESQEGPITPEPSAAAPVCRRSLRTAGRSA